MPRKPAKKSKTKTTSTKKPAKKTAAAKKPAAKTTGAKKPAAKKPALTPMSSLGSTPEKVAKLGIQRTVGTIYFIKENEVWRMHQGTTEKVTTADFEREDGWLYFLDGDGDISRSKSNQPTQRSGRYDEIEE